jgi:hypothetical protein
MTSAAGKARTRAAAEARARADDAAARASATAAAEAACLALLEGHLDAGSLPDLGGTAESLLDAALRELVRRHGGASAPLVRRLADEAGDKTARKAARRALYRLEQAGVAVPAAPTPPPAAVVKRERERAIRSWLSGIDGSGSRAAWIIFEGGVGGGLRLCSLILNDEAGILEVAGGPITRRRLDAELASLRESQKLPWIDSPPERTRGLVAEALAVHERAGTRPPAEFARWRPLFESAPPPEDDDAPADPALADRAVSLLELPELLGWFVDPAAIQEESVARLEMQDSRLIVADHVKVEREAAIVDRVVEKGFSEESRPRWARRFREMALVFAATGRDEPAALARAAATALADVAEPATRVAVARGLAARGLEVAGEVALGRVRLADVTRGPRPPAGGAASAAP